MAGRYDFSIQQGETFSRTFTWKDASGTAVNLTGYKATIHFTRGSTLLKTLTSPAEITLGGTAGTIVVKLSAAETKTLRFTTANYDLEMDSGSTVKRLLIGSVTLMKDEV